MTHDRWSVPQAVEATAQAMTKAERRSYLRTHGWRKLGGSDTWVRLTFDDPDGDHGLYSLAAAIRTALFEGPDV